MKQSTYNTLNQKEFEILCKDVLHRVDKNKKFDALRRQNGKSKVSAQERRLQSYQDYINKWDDHENKVMNYFEDSEVKQHGSLEKADQKKNKILFGTLYGSQLSTSL